MLCVPTLICLICGENWKLETANPVYLGPLDPCLLHIVDNLFDSDGGIPYFIWKFSMVENDIKILFSQGLSQIGSEHGEIFATFSGEEGCEYKILGVGCLLVR